MTTLPTIDALGTRWWIEIFDELSDEKCTAIHAGCALLLSAFENRYSRFLPSSLLSTLNTTKKLSPADQEFRTLLSYGIALYDRSHGAFNLMIGDKLITTGYDAAYSFTPKAPTTAVEDPHQSIQIIDTSVTLLSGSIDIGGYGKGYALDMLAGYLQKEGISYFLINGGGDMYATSDHESPITVYLEHPTNQSEYLETTTIFNQGFAASSPHKRTWSAAGKTYTHIISSTDAPLCADATFIKAGLARDADAFATVALLLPPETFARIAEKEGLGTAHYSLKDGTLIHNALFTLTNSESALL